MRTLLRTLSIAMGCIAWQWVHNHDSWSFYDNTQGTDVIALLAGLLVGGFCWWLSDEATR